jgi:hypothetical protein
MNPIFTLSPCAKHTLALPRKCEQRPEMTEPPLIVISLEFLQ